MSDRHVRRRGRVLRPSRRIRLPEPERQRVQRTTRRRTHQQLHRLCTDQDWDEAVLPEPNRYGARPRILAPADDVPRRGRQAVRFWRLSFWKRRSQVRRWRAELERQGAADG